MKIYGAGMAGLIAGHFFRRHSPTIFEAQPSLPNNHSALLRFRSNIVSEVTGIKFKEVTVRKNIYFERELYNECNIAFANLYAQKVTNAVEGRSIWNLEPVKRYIAPPNFIELLAEGLDIRYSSSLDSTTITKNNEPMISTIPVPALMKMTDWPSFPNFLFKPIWSLTCDLNIPCDVYQTIYFPGTKTLLYRASLSGNHLILEFIDDPKLSIKKYMLKYAVEALNSYFGIIVEERHIKNCQEKKQQYGKIISDLGDDVKSFVMAMTDRHHIYSLGRFATWRQLLLDDMIQDCKVIQRLIETKSSYERKLLNN